MAELMPIWIVGVGPGDPGYITAQALALVQSANAVAGFAAPLATVARWIRGAQILLNYQNQEVQLKLLAERAAQGQRCVLCAQGDPSLSAGELVQRVKNIWQQVEVVPGISSAQVVCARAGLDLDRCIIFSFHKRGDTAQDRLEFVNAAKDRNRHIIALPGPDDFMPSHMAEYLIKAGVPKTCHVLVFERLTLKDERRTSLSLEQLMKSQEQFDDLSIFVMPALAS